MDKGLADFSLLCRWIQLINTNHDPMPRAATGSSTTLRERAEFREKTIANLR